MLCALYPSRDSVTPGITLRIKYINTGPYGSRFYRAMHRSAKRGLAIACRLSVRLSVTLVDQDHIGWKSWKLIARIISPTPSLFVARGEHGKIWEILGTGCGKVVCWSTKAAISLKRVKIKQKVLWRAYRNSPTLFRTVPSPTGYGLFFPKIGCLQPPPKTQIAIISGTSRATDFKFGRYIHRVHANKGPLKVVEKGERGRIQGLPILGYPIISGTLLKFKFCKHIYRLNRKKSPLKISGKVAVGIVRDSRDF